MAPNDDDSKNSESLPRLRVALEQARPAMEALAKDELLAINLAPLEVVARVGAALPKLLTLKARVAAELTNFDSTHFDRLELYARALLQAQIVYNATSRPPPELSALSDEASKLRVLLLSDLSALTIRKQIHASCLEGLKRQKGHRNVAGDVMVAATILRNHWAAISGSTAVTEAELDRAEFLGAEILRLICQKRKKPEAVIKAELDRVQAYTLLLRTYNEIRKAVLFVLRQQGDADKLAPSLYLKRRRTKPGKLTGDAAATATVTANEVTPVNPLPATLVASSPLPLSGVNAETPIAGSTRIPIGLPGSDPFIH